VPNPGPLSERALILAPEGRDGQIAKLILEEAGFPSEICQDRSGGCRPVHLLLFKSRV